jgi:hypothetical protein
MTSARPTIVACKVCSSPIPVAKRGPMPELCFAHRDRSNRRKSMRALARAEGRTPPAPSPGDIHKLAEAARNLLAALAPFLPSPEIC